MIKLFVAIICILCLTVNYSCKEKSTQPIEEFTGITETNSTGPEPIGNIDPDDWKPMMNCPPASNSIRYFSRSLGIEDTIIVTAPNCTKIYPAYPNPANKSFAIQFSLNQKDSVLITMNITPGIVVKELVKSRLMAGPYHILVDGSDLKPAIYRVYISVFRQSDILSSYGDFQIVE